MTKLESGFCQSPAYHNILLVCGVIRKMPCCEERGTRDVGQLGIVDGVRQVGKTFILKEFGSCYYEKMAYVNCDKNKMLEKIFAQDYNISRILLSLSAILHINIEPENTLIIFDEIQESPTILNSLKYFCEDAPQYHVVVAGSLLGISLHRDTSFPVGKVDMMKMYPMTFDDFICIYCILINLFFFSYI